MNTANVGAGRLERRVRREGRETMPGVHGFCSFYPFVTIRGKSQLSLTALSTRFTCSIKCKICNKRCCCNKN